MKLFALNASAGLGHRIAEALGIEVAQHEEREFSWGEHKARPLTSVAGENAVVVSSLHGDSRLSVNDKICRLLFFAGALRDAGARGVTAVVPYLAYSRKDRRTKPRDPVTTRYLASAFESVGIDRCITLDVHNAAALDNSFRCQAINIETTMLFATHYHETLGDAVDSIVSPDLGGIKATRAFADALGEMTGRGIRVAVMDKKRSEGKVSGSGLIGDIGEHVLIVDDMIGSGTTLCRAASACLEAGAHRVSVGATHGLFQDGAPALFGHPGIDSITVTDSVTVQRLDLPADHLARLTTLGSAPLMAACIESLNL